MPDSQTFENTDDRSPDGFEGRHRLAPISLPLHEALGLCMLFRAADPDLVQSLEANGINFALSAARGFLRLRRAIAELYEDEETIDLIALETAQLDQVQASW